jgi:hypothetical protein
MVGDLEHCMLAVTPVHGQLDHSQRRKKGRRQLSRYSSLMNGSCLTFEIRTGTMIRLLLHNHTAFSLSYDRIHQLVTKEQDSKQNTYRGVHNQYRPTGGMT